MARDYFEFKQFKVWQDKCAMKVGTDGVLLGAWIQAEGNLNILDVGSGTGLIALMLAQKTSGKIDSIEIEKDAFQQATENFLISPWSNRLKCIHKSIQELASKTNQKYNLIISNPPFFNSGIKSADSKRAQARHSDSLTLMHLVMLSTKLLETNGRLGVILPYETRNEFIKCISLNGLWVMREARIRPLPCEQYVRIMFEVGNCISNNYTIEEIVIEEGKRHKYAASFKNYTIDFYLEQYMQ